MVKAVTLSLKYHKCATCGNEDIMVNTKLITLLEIAEEVGVNYRTLISCKREFSDFVFGISEGRLMRYPYEYTNFFRLIFALKDQGYTVSVMKAEGDRQDLQFF